MPTMLTVSRTSEDQNLIQAIDALVRELQSFHVPLNFSSSLDPGQAALMGAFIGAGASIFVQIIAAFFMAQHETRSFHRTLHKERIASVADIYELTLNVIFNMRRDGNPDRATLGNVFAQISLRGSPSVKNIIEAFLQLPPAEMKVFDIEPLVIAMQEHLTRLESDSK